MTDSQGALVQAGVFFGITLAISGSIVWLIGGIGDNPDAAILAVLVPTLVAVVLTARFGGWPAVKNLLRLGGFHQLYLALAAALLAPVLALIAIVAGGAVTGDTFDFEMPDEGIAILIPLLVIALGEEYGWRGYALPRLQGRYSALAASLVVGLVWWVWHYPAALIDTGVPLDTPFWLFGIYVVSFSILMAAVFNATRSSMGLMILFHFSSNAAFVFTPLLPENRGGELTTLSIFVGLAATAAVVAVGLGHMRERPATVSQ